MIFIKRLKKKKLLYVISLLILFISIVFISEGVSRAFISKNELNSAAKIYTHSETLGWKFKPNAEVLFEDIYGAGEFVQPIKINSKGLRDYEYDYEKPPNTFRILMMGNSIAAGLEVPLEDTFENILEKRLNSGNKKYEVINLAVRAYSPQQEFILLQEEGMKYNPDLVILNFYPGHDFRSITKSPLFKIENGDLKRTDYAQPVKLIRIRGFLSGNSALFNLVSRLKTESREVARTLRVINPFIEIMKPLDQRVDLNYEMVDLLIKNISDFAKEQNKDFTIVLIPFREQIDENKLKEMLIAENETMENIELDWSTNEIKRIANKNNIKIIDLLPEMRASRKNNEFYFNQSEHLTIEGHRQIGNLIYQKLPK